MKTRLLVIIGMVGLSLVVNSQQADGLCMENEDWADAPCWSKRCANSNEPACTDSNWWKERWGSYYDYKGKEWMEIKKSELLDAIEKNNFVEWKSLTRDSAHDNVYNYYFYMGEIPNSDGMFVDQIFATENFALNAYEQLNYRLDTDPEFAQLVQTKVVGFGVDEQNQGIFIVVDPTYANQENMDNYEEIFRETIGESIPITFEVRERAGVAETQDYDFRIPAIVSILIGLVVAIYYFWRKK